MDNIINVMKFDDKFVEAVGTSKDMPINLQIPRKFLTHKDLFELVQKTAEGLKVMDIPLKAIEMPPEPLFNIEAFSLGALGRDPYVSIIMIIFLYRKRIEETNLDYYSDIKNLESRSEIGGRTSRPIIICNADVSPKSEKVRYKAIEDEEFGHMFKEVIVNINSSYDNLGPTRDFIDKIQKKYEYACVKICLNAKNLKEVCDSLEDENMLNYIGSIKMVNIKDKNELKEMISKVKSIRNNLPIMVNCKDYNEYTIVTNEVLAKGDRTEDSSNLFNWE